jgi:hypothetical protein
MNSKQIEQDVLKVCLALILNSKYDDWSSAKSLIIDNVYIDCYYNYFHIKIYSDSSCNRHLYSVDLARRWVSIKNNKIGYIKNILLRKKLRDINNYFNNKEKYDYILNVYNSLPSKIMRKSKLEKLNK